ncbi:MAG: hypothetical protein VB085_07455 [Peptococcaceae bacterium]|nr:hypothetical protein [Peptococcaceae bacterium]
MEDKNVNSNYKSIQQKQEQKRAKRKTQKRNRHMLVLVGLILLASGIYSMYGFLMTYAADIDIVEAASWDNVLTCRGWSFQQESVVITDLPGTVVPILNEGERISKGVEIGRFNYQNTESLSEPGNRRLYSPMAGILSYNVDGLEFVAMKRDYQVLSVELIEAKLGQQGYFAPEAESGGITDILQEKLDQESGSQENEENLQTQGAAGPKAVPAGQGIFKVTDNLSDCYLYLRTESQLEIPFQPEDTVNLRMETEAAGILTGKAEVIECSSLGQGESPAGWGILVKLSSGLEPLRHTRQHILDLVISTEEVGAVSSGALVEKEGVKGLYLYKKNTVTWTPVEVLSQTEGRLLVRGVEPGDAVITRPWLVRDGMKLRLGS